MDMKTALKTALENEDTTALVEINDWAVNEVRDWCHDRGYDAGRLVAEEAQRIAADRMSLETYKRARRIGSTFRLTRVMRIRVWTIVKTRQALRRTFPTV